MKFVRKAQKSHIKKDFMHVGKPLCELNSEKNYCIFIAKQHANVENVNCTSIVRFCVAHDDY